MFATFGTDVDVLSIVDEMKQITEVTCVFPSTLTNRNSFPRAKYIFHVEIKFLPLYFFLITSAEFDFVLFTKFLKPFVQFTTASLATTPRGYTIAMGACITSVMYFRKRKTFE